MRIVVWGTNGVRSSEFGVWSLGFGGRWALRVALHGAHHHPDPKLKFIPTFVSCVRILRE